VKHASENSATRHKEASAQVGAPPERVFAHLDDQTHLAEHMSRPSLMMGGGRMTYDFDEGQGQAVGSHIRMGGTAFGLKLFVDEVVTERVPPARKVWRTVGSPTLIVIEHYEMGFEVAPANGGSMLRVWIDYELRSRGLARVMPWLADSYARWCVQRMTRDARDTFGVAETIRANGQVSGKAR
jgi:hypothetical protein